MIREEHNAYHSDVQKIIDRLKKIQDVFASEHIEDAMRMLVIQSWEIKAHRDPVSRDTWEKFEGK
jgi:hypothetical protein